jgi:hypothetical protein
MVSCRHAADPPNLDGRRCETPRRENVYVREEDHKDNRFEEALSEEGCESAG